MTATARLSNSLSRKQFPVSWVFALALAFLGVNVLAISPGIADRYGAVAGNMTYLLVRVGATLAFAWVLGRFYRRTRFQAVSVTAFLIFLDQALFKSLLLVMDWRAHPEAWSSPDKGAAIFGVFASYMISCPAIFILAFLGYELSALSKVKGR